MLCNLIIVYLTRIYASVFDAKRLIGRKFADAEVQADLKHFPFKVIVKNGKPYVRVQYRGEDKEFVSCCSILVSIVVLMPCAVARGDIVHGSRENEGDSRVLPWNNHHGCRCYGPRFL